MDGSKGLAPGVTRAFRFWEMVSSTAPRDTRRKSGGLGYERELGAGGSLGMQLTSECGLVEAELWC